MLICALACRPGDGRGQGARVQLVYQGGDEARGGHGGGPRAGSWARCRSFRRPAGTRRCPELPPRPCPVRRCQQDQTGRVSRIQRRWPRGHGVWALVLHETDRWGLAAGLGASSPRRCCFWPRGRWAAPSGRVDLGVAAENWGLPGLQRSFHHDSRSAHLWASGGRARIRSFGPGGRRTANPSGRRSRRYQGIDDPPPAWRGDASHSGGRWGFGRDWAREKPWGPLAQWSQHVCWVWGVGGDPPGGRGRCGSRSPVGDVAGGVAAQ